VKHREVGFQGGNVWQGECHNVAGVGKRGAGLGQGNRT
jgi:hypothetical protein